MQMNNINNYIPEDVKNLKKVNKRVPKIDISKRYTVTPEEGKDNNTTKLH